MSLSESNPSTRPEAIIHRALDEDEVPILRKHNKAALDALAVLVADRDSWRRVAREYEQALADRKLL